MKKRMNSVLNQRSYSGAAMRLCTSTYHVNEVDAWTPTEWDALHSAVVVISGTLCEQCEQVYWQQYLDYEC
jgi:hypothetical protein